MTDEDGVVPGAGCLQGGGAPGIGSLHLCDDACRGWQARAPMCRLAADRGQGADQAVLRKLAEHCPGVTQRGVGTARARCCNGAGQRPM